MQQRMSKQEKVESGRIANRRGERGAASQSSASGATDTLLQMQQTAGNRAMQRMLAQGAKSAPVQRKGSSNMPGDVRAKMESALGADFSDVSIHEGSEASSVGALAYTQGSEIHFAPGRYAPNTREGQELLGHELTHVIQQRQGRVKPTTEVNGLPVNDDAGLEKEADSMGRRAVASPAPAVSGNYGSATNGSSPAQAKMAPAPNPPIQMRPFSKKKYAEEETGEQQNEDAENVSSDLESSESEQESEDDELIGDSTPLPGGRKRKYHA